MAKPSSRSRRRAKRARAAALSGSITTCTRDWASIGGDGPAGLIADLSLASDVADYVRFRAVCRSWRRCSPEDPRTAGLDSRFLPRKWIMLDNAHAAARRHRFLNVSTGECIRTDLPELAEHSLLTPTPEGLLLLLHEPTLVVRLLNPITRQLTGLPPVTALLPPELRRRRQSGCQLGGSFRVRGAGIVADDDASAAVVVYFHSCYTLAVAKPGHERWTVVQGKDGEICSALPFAGRFYCTTRKGIMVLDTSGSDQQPPRLVTAVETKAPRFIYNVIATETLHLVDNGGQLMLVYRNHKLGYNELSWVDLGAGTLIPVESFGGRAVFMGMHRAICVSPEAFPFVKADTMYLGFDCDGETLGYNVVDGSTEPCHYKPFLRAMVHPCSVVDYCIQSCHERRSICEWYFLNP
ncbi:unnamed protein product [Urochloa decumbens]|uniref:KIB1-4 beta-propeller domain-containing protein n=1 Tax=Urochloa decumbens TaxID=240449 RepID=A0ABC9FWY9_9POAL